jgi:hypothetical protein
MTKQEKIQEAYGEHWELVKNYVDENGWFYSNSSEYVKIFHTICMSVLLDPRRQEDLCSYRPKSLSGIEDNNGWIKIESESDLPKEESIMYRLGMFLNDGRFHQDSNLCTLTTAIAALNWNYTHYQPVGKKKEPIY